MAHKLNLKAAEAYGHLLDFFVPFYMRDEFSKKFEEFLDAYDGDRKPDETQPAQGVEAAERRKLAKIDEAYRRFINNEDATYFPVRRQPNGSTVIQLEETQEA